MYDKLKSRYQSILEDNPFKPLKTAVYEALRNSIILFDIKPGTQLNEKQIAEVLNVSRSVVSSAMELLQKNELVTKEKSKRPKAASFSLQNFKNLMKLRSAIESIASEQMAISGTPAEKQCLVKKCNRINDYIDKKAYHDFIIADMDFHTYIVKCSQNSYLMLAYEQLLPRINQYMLIQAPYRIDNDIALRYEHDALCNAILKGNPDYANLAAKIHCSAVFLSDEEIQASFQYTINNIVNEN